MAHTGYKRDSKGCKPKAWVNGLHKNRFTSNVNRKKSVYKQVYKRVYATNVEKLIVMYISKLCKPKTYIKVINIDYR